MKFSEYFQHVLSVVADITELPADEIISRGRREDLVNARQILIYIFYEDGYYPKQIAKMLGRSSSGINKIVSEFDNRLKTDKQLRFNYQTIVNKLQIK